VLTTSPNLFVEIYVDRLLCDGCGYCVDNCTMGVFTISDGRADPLRAEICIACFKCHDFCPNHAISARWIMRVA